MGQPSDPPPSYEDTIASDPLVSSSSGPPPANPLPPDSQPQYSVRADTRDPSSVLLTPALSHDASALHDLLVHQARIPPHPYLNVRGSHTETRRDDTRKKDESETVIDFNFRIDLSGYMVRDEPPPITDDDYDTGVEVDPQDGWRVLGIVRDHDGQKAYRGGRTRSETWTGHTRTKRSPSRQLEAGPESESAELVPPDENGPGLMGWCERFCEDPAPVKSFAFTRSIVGFDSSVVRSALTSHLRSLQYQGNVDLTISLENKTLTVYSPHWTNRWRNNGYIFWICVILQLWIIAWPILWFLEHRYDVVSAVWYFSRDEGGQRHYAGYRDEAAVAEVLAPAVTQAALERRRDGKTLTVQELQLLDRLGRERQGRGVMVMTWDRFQPWGRDS
ncbi:hypothetical protein BO70DRAFT_336440 [Aspergillus heteromorphus CBS 117.55]|uniref:Uncharacterized protein n=1 Tax=Aspergillus heteromorphus CBS 117.55 TaxID=1448321 RepID=A0A317WD46_9EURO|nr:uncharacterized protein BO70DRAFT_336440 [Aspergillus heteromorphus CBS 117.55]PWY82090.1 hypothetical protein BO70DRAFT_336440 [Aspergillus heteromorphus CBS 117.55]